MKLRFTALLVLSLFWGCASLPHATLEDVHRANEQWPQTSLSSLEEGRSTYVAHCSGCHALHLPSDKTPSQWPRIVDEMSKKAKITEQQKELIGIYLVTLSRRQEGSSVGAFGKAAGPRTTN